MKLSFLIFAITICIFQTVFGFNSSMSRQRMGAYVEGSTENNVTYTCDTGWKYFNKSCYLIDNGYQYQNWQTSLDWCRAFGANLASVHTLEEDKFLNQLMETSPQALGGKCKANWIGLTCFCANSYDCSTRGCWWADSTPVDMNLLDFTKLQLGVELGVFKVSESCRTEWNNLYIVGGQWISYQKSNYNIGYLCRKNATVQTGCGPSTHSTAPPVQPPNPTMPPTQETTFQPHKLNCFDKLMAEELAKGNNDPYLKYKILDKCKNKNNDKQIQYPHNPHNYSSQKLVTKKKKIGHGNEKRQTNFDV